MEMDMYSVALYGIDSYTRRRLYLPYKMEAASANAAVREARKRAKTFYPRFEETEKPDVEVVRR